jgi:anaerobic selenocysteine-containing dehydrogenase
MAEPERIHTYCGLCIARCGAIAVVEEGRFTRLEPDPAHPTGAALCAKGRAAPELVYHPQRLTHPLRRTRPKGDPDPGWQRISWDEALGLTVAAICRAAEQYGPQAVAFTVSSPSTTAIADSSGFIRRLANALAIPNWAVSLDVCGWGRAFATRFTYGVASVGTGGAGGAMPDIANTGLLILWGYNPSFTRLTHATAAVEALKRGMRLLVVDPRRVGLAAKADLWLRLRPGTDGALALGIAHVMIEEGWYDRDFIRTWSNGPHLVREDTGRFLTEADVISGGDARRFFAWDGAASRLVAYDTVTGLYDGDSAGLALDGEYPIATRAGEIVCHPAFEIYRRLCRQYPPETVEAICWLPRAEVEEAARVIWHSRPVSYYAWSGHEQHANVTQTARAISLLYALTGSFDAKGGNVLFAAPAAAPITGEELPAAKGMAPALGLSEQVADLGQGINGRLRPYAHVDDLLRKDFQAGHERIERHPRQAVDDRFEVQRSVHRREQLEQLGEAVVRAAERCPDARRDFDRGRLGVLSQIFRVRLQKGAGAKALALILTE